MSNRESSPSPDVDDLLAPPPFGVAETTSEQLLPIPTSMEELLDAPEPAAPSQVADEPLPALARVPTAARAVIPAAETPPTPPRPAAEVQRPARRSGLFIVLAAVVVLGLGGLVGWALTQEASPPDEGVVSSAAIQPAPSPAAEPQPVEPPRAKELPTSKAELQAMTFKDRHALLATTRGEVAVELHVGLDLLQAEQAEDPCRTFADALNTIEASQEPELYRWALNDAAPPLGSEAACEGLQARLDGVREPDAVPAPTPTKRKRPNRKRPRTASPPANTPAASPKPPAKPASSPSVATKLDDDLRGLGD